MVGTMKRNFKMYIKYFPLLHFFSRLANQVSVIVSLFLIYFVMFGGNVATETSSYINDIDYFTYAIVGVIAETTAISVIMSVSRSLITELREGTIQSLVISPYNFFSYHVGILLEQMWRLIIEIVIAVIVGQIFGADLVAIPLLTWVVGLGLVTLSSFAIGLLLSNVMLFFRDTFIVQNTVFSIILLFCGITFPIEYFPEFLQNVSYWIPITGSLHIFRDLITSPYVTNDIGYQLGCVLFVLVKQNCNGLE